MCAISPYLSFSVVAQRWQWCYLKDDKPSIQVNGSGGVQLGHKTEHITIQTITIFLHKLYEVLDINKKTSQSNSFIH